MLRRSTIKIALLGLALPSLALSLVTLLYLFLAPKDYLAHWSPFMQALLHPYLLVMYSELLLALGSGFLCCWYFIDEEPKG